MISAVIEAMILPTNPIDDETVDQVVTRALESGLIACNKMTGPFRISFFKRDNIPDGWAKFGCTTKDTPCAA